MKKMECFQTLADCNCFLSLQMSLVIFTGQTKLLGCIFPYRRMNQKKFQIFIHYSGIRSCYGSHSILFSPISQYSFSLECSLQLVIRLV